MLNADKCALFPNLLLVYLFGSEAKGKSKQGSDTDIAVLLKEPIQDRVQTQLDLQHFFQMEFSKEVDLTLLNGAGSVLKYQVAKHGKILFEKTKGMNKNFRIRAWKEYFDFQPTLEFFYKRKVA